MYVVIMQPFPSPSERPKAETPKHTHNKTRVGRGQTRRKVLYTHFREVGKSGRDQ